MPRTFLIALFSLSILLFAICVSQLRAGPCLRMDDWSESDMHFFKEWAVAIREGDLLSRSVHSPLHLWHVSVAEDFQRLHAGSRPPTSSEVSSASDSLHSIRRLWDTWSKHPRFYQEPLFPYGVALAASVAGCVRTGGIALNGLVGALTNVLAALIAFRLFGRTAGILAGLMALACGPIHVFDFTLLRDSGVIFTTLLLPGLMILLRDDPRRRTPIILGVAFGLALGLKSIFALLLPVALLTILPPGGSLRSWAPLERIALFVGSITLAVSPWLARAAIVGGGGVGFPLSAEVSFVQGNSATSSYSNAFFSVTEMAEIFSTTLDSGFPAVALATLRTHPNVGTYLALLGQKVFACLNWVELPNNVNLYYMSLHSPVLRYMLVSAAIIIPFGLLGICLAWTVRRTMAPYYVLLSVIFVHFVVMLGFIVCARLRAPLLAALLPFAAFGISECVQMLRRRDWKLLFRLVVLVSIPSVVVLWNPNGDPEAHISSTDYLVGLKIDTLPKYFDAEGKGDWPRALEAVDNGLKLEPRSLSQLNGLVSLPEDAELRANAYTFGLLHNLRSDILTNLGRHDEASHEAMLARRYSSVSGQDLPE